MILYEFQKQTVCEQLQIQNQPDPSLHTSVDDDITQSTPTPLSKSATRINTLFSGSSVTRDTAYLLKMSASSTLKSKGIRQPTRRVSEPIIIEEPELLSSESKPERSLSVTSGRPPSAVPSIALLQVQNSEAEQDPEDMLLTPTQFKRISLAVDRILGDHLAPSTSSPTNNSVSTFFDKGDTRPGLANPNTTSHAASCVNVSCASPVSSAERDAGTSDSAASRVHEELFKALSIQSTSSSPPTASAQDSASTRLSSDMKSLTESHRSISCASARSSHHHRDSQSSFNSHSSSSVSSSFRGSIIGTLHELELATSPCQIFERRAHDHSVIPKLAPPAMLEPTHATPSKLIDPRQFILDSHLRYFDLIAIQNTLVASAPPFSSDASTWAHIQSKLSVDPLLKRHASSSTTSQSSGHHPFNISPRPVRSSSMQALSKKTRTPQAKLARGIGSCDRMRSKPKSVEGSLSALPDAVSSSSSDARNQTPSLPSLLSPSPSSNFSPESHSFPLTPPPPQPVELTRDVSTWASSSLSPSHRNGQFLSLFPLLSHDSF